MDEYLVPTDFGEDEFTEKKSRFIGRVWQVESEEAALERIQAMKKQHYDATHNCWDGKSKLCFGDISGHGTYDDEPLTLHWPDGSTDVITVKASAIEGYRSVKLNRKFKLNGKVVARDTSSPEINIVK